MDKDNNQYKDRSKCFLARIVLEAQTPLKIGSGRESIGTDATINRDVNNLPYIPGTTLAGLIRHAIEADDAKTAERIMGWQNRNDGHGSSLVVSEAKLVVGEDGSAVDGLLDTDSISDKAVKEYIDGFAELPVRQHVKITHKGTAEDKGKFDEEIVPKGVRFCFEMELKGDEQARDDFSRLLEVVRSTTFRVGGGSRKGFGEVVVRSIDYRELDLNNSADFNEYIEKSSSLGKPWNGYKKASNDSVDDGNAVSYKLELKPVDFIFFSSGLGDKDTGADNSYVKEKFADWSDGKPKWVSGNDSLVIPGSSVKGAVSHRTAFYYNLEKGLTTENVACEEHPEGTGTKNEAVRNLFGCEGDKDENKKIISGSKRRGRVLISDVIRKKNNASKPKIINHVKIDRFTGGAIQGALFDELPLYANSETIELNVTVLKDKSGDADQNKEAEDALIKALTDICRGTLPLGGSVNRGNGCFHGRLTNITENKLIYDFNDEQNENK